jgi:large subunit ribosomal protein L25
MTTTLTATKREGTPDAIRAQELVPAIYYGSGKDAVSITVPLKEFTKALKEAGESTTISLQLGGEKINTLIHDIQRDPLSGLPIHIDFLVIDMNKEIEVAVPIEFTGLAAAEKNGLGTLVKVMYDVQVKALPANLPHSVTVDVTGLATLDDQIHAKDIALGDKVELITNPDEVVALVTPFVEEKEEPTTIDLSLIEVEKKGKEEEPAEGEAAE